jgi:hypothetical protein
VGTLLLAVEKSGAVVWQQPLGFKANIHSVEMRDGHLTVAGDFTDSLALGGTVKAAQGPMDLFFASLNKDGSARFVNSLVASHRPSSSFAQDDGAGGLFAWGFTSDSISWDESLPSTLATLATLATQGFFLAHADAQGKWTSTAGFPAAWSADQQTGWVESLALSPRGTVAVAATTPVGAELGGPVPATPRFIGLFDQVAAATPSQPPPCLPPPVHKAETLLGWGADTTTFLQVKVHGNRVVWATNAEIYEAPLSGGPSTLLATGQSTIGTLVFAGDDLYWTTSHIDTSSGLPADSKSRAELRVLTHDAPRPMVVAGDLPPYITGLAATKDAIYWSGWNDVDFQQGRIGRVAFGANKSESIATGMYPLVASDGTNLAWAITTADKSSLFDTQVFRGTPGSPISVRSISGYLTNLAMEGDDVVWIEQGEFGQSLVTNRNASPARSVDLLQIVPQSLTLSGGDIFFMESTYGVVDDLVRPLGGGFLGRLAKADNYINVDGVTKLFNFAASANAWAEFRLDEASQRWTLVARPR